MAYRGEVAAMAPVRRKPGRITNVVVDKLDDGTYTLCGYDSDHRESKKMSARGAEDMMGKMMAMMGAKAKDKMEEAGE